MFSSSSTSRPAVVDVPKVRIAVIGDSGVGKTSLVHRLCHGTALPKPQWTIGCSVELKLYRHAKRDRDFFLELWDIGGSHKYRLTRHVFFSQLNGIVLVYDVNNRNSYRNLRTWIKEIVDTNEHRHPVEYSSNRRSGFASGPPSRHGSLLRKSPRWAGKKPVSFFDKGSSASSSSLSSQRELESVVTIPTASRSPPPMLKRYGVQQAAARSSSSALRDLPILVVGNKLDNPAEKNKPNGVASEFNPLRDLGIDGCFVSAHHWTNSAELDLFFTRVIERRHYSSEYSAAHYSSSGASAGQSEQPSSGGNVRGAGSFGANARGPVAGISTTEVVPRPAVAHSHSHTYTHSHSHTHTTHIVHHQTPSAGNAHPVPGLATIMSSNSSASGGVSAPVGASGSASGRSAFRVARPRPQLPFSFGGVSGLIGSPHIGGGKGSRAD